MPSGTLHYRFRIRTATDEADLFIVHALRDGLNPYIKEAPSGEGSSLDPLTGKVTIGAYTVKVIDAPGTAYNPSGSAIADGWEYANQGAAESAGWVFTNTLPGGSIIVGATDHVQAGSKSLGFTTTESSGLSNGGSLKAAKLYDAGDGVLADTLYRCTVYARMDTQDWFDANTRLTVNGVVGSLSGTGGSFGLITVTVRSSATATLNVALSRSDPYVRQAHIVHFDTLSLQPLVPAATLEGRVVTSSLADLDGKQQLMSKRAFVEESEDEGATWSVLCAGYINDVKFSDALLAEFTVGDSKRVEQEKRVFDRISDPYEHPDLIGIMDRASAIAGGPVVGDFAGNRDRGRPLFQVENVYDDIVLLGWRNGGGSLHSVYKEDGPPMKDYIAEYMTDAAREYVDFSSWTQAGDHNYAPAPDLVTRIYDPDTSAWLSDQGTMLEAAASSPTDIGDWILCGTHGRMSVRWSGTVPSVGDFFRLAIFPRTTSERNPMHYSGHPMDLVRDCCIASGIAYDETSRLAMRAYLGDDLQIEIRVTAGDTHQSFLEKTVYGIFGVASRPNDAGELEFIATRNPDTVSSGTITEADLPTDFSGMLWGIEEGTACNNVVLESLKIGLDKRRPDDHQTPFDARRTASITIGVKPPDQQLDEQEVYGDKEQRFTLPGCIRVGGEILAAGSPAQGETPGVPGPLDLWVGAMAQPIFTWQQRGAIRAELDVRRGVTDARIGDVLTLDLGYFPSANPGQSPVSQRGTDPRRAVVLRRTVKPDRVSFLLEDRGLAAELECGPTFTLAADATFPKTTVAVTVTNEDDLLSPIRVEMAQGASEPAGSGQFVRLFRPNQDTSPFNLPPVCAGNTVWVRMRCEQNGQVGTWTAWDSIDLADLVAPSALSAVVNNTSILLSWTNGETTYPVEILARLDADTTLQSVAVLPAGSTSYTLLLTQAETDYVLGVRYIDPKGCTSATTTISTSTDIPLCLPAPTNLAAFADGAGSYGVELDAAVIPGGVEVWVATETALGSGVAGTYALADIVQAVTPPIRTRWTVSSPVGNDGLLRFMKAESSQAGYTSCDFSDAVSVNPWTLVDPTDPGDPSDPAEVPGITNVILPIALHRPGASGLVLIEPGSDRAVITTIRGTEEKPILTGVSAARINAVVVASTLPVGAYLAVEFENPAVPDDWHPIEDATDDPLASGPTLDLDPTSLDALDPAASGSRWNVSGPFVVVRDEAQDDVRIRVVVGGGDETGALILGAVSLLPRIGPAGDPGDETGDPPTEDPGSCDTPGDLDDWSSYANEAALLVAWPEN